MLAPQSKPLGKLAHALGVINHSSDREHEIIINRLVLITIALTVTSVLEASTAIMAGLQLHLLASIILAIAYQFGSKPNNLRRFAGLCTEFVAGMYLFQVGGGSVAILYPIYLWAILGYGFRFGLKWLFIAMAMAFVSFGWSVYSVEYWHQNKSLAFGLLSGLIIIPVYCSTLIRRLSKAKEKAEQANKAKSLFLAGVSHELRTPLNAIIGYGTHLLDAGLTLGQRQMVSTSVSAGRHLLHLINQLLDYAQSETNEQALEAKEFNLLETLTDVRDIMQIAAEEKNLIIVLQANPMSDAPIIGHVDHIRNILINLTSNAVKFTEMGSVTIRCALHDTSYGLELICSISDTGPGIPVNAQDKIFDIFQQADDTISQNFGGTGLGLAICRQLAQQIGGDVSVESSVGIGSTFKLRCPVKLAENPESLVVEEVARILSIGSKPCAPFIKETEKRAVNIKHIFVKNGASAVDMLSSEKLEKYDLALIDDNTANRYKNDGNFWDLFKRANLAPVLVSDANMQNIGDLELRAAFASVLPQSADFDELRSVIRIGCSFTRKFDTDKTALTSNLNHNAELHILIADDNRTNRLVLETILSGAGHIVTSVHDGDEALEQLQQRNFDLVFLDVNMPNLSGIECCRLWRQIEGPRQRVPIIGLTADSTNETEKKCLNAGMDQRMTKPIDASVLLEVICSYSQIMNIDSKCENTLLGSIEIVNSVGSEADYNNIASLDMHQLDYLQSIGDNDFVTSIVESYLDDVATIIVEFENSVTNSNVEDFRFHAHAFRSASHNVGAVRLSKICADLEVITEAKFINNKSQYFEKVKNELKIVTDLLLNSDYLTKSSENLSYKRKTLAQLWYQTGRIFLSILRS